MEDSGPRVDVSPYERVVQEITVAAAAAEPGYIVEQFSGYFSDTDDSFYTATDDLPATLDGLETYLSDRIIIEVYLDANLPEENTPFNELKLTYRQEGGENTVEVFADGVDDPGTWAMCKDALVDNLQTLDRVDTVDASEYINRPRGEEFRRENW